MTRQYDNPEKQSRDYTEDQTSGGEKFVYLIRQLITVVILPVAIIVVACIMGCILRIVAPRPNAASVNTTPPWST